MTDNGNIFSKLLSLLVYKDRHKLNEFYIPETDEAIAEMDEALDENDEKKHTVKKSEERHKSLKKPTAVSELTKEKNSEAKGSIEKKADDKTISDNIDENIEFIKSVFNSPSNKDLIIREFNAGQSKRAFVAFLDGMADKKVINLSILRPLLVTDKIRQDGAPCQTDAVLKDILETNQAVKVTDPGEAVSEILSGNTLLYIEGCSFYISNETKGFPARSVDKPQTEGVVTGPQEAYNESVRTNISLIRKIIKNPNLTTEFLKIGKRNKSQCAIMYLRDVANRAVVDEVKRRIASLDTDFIYGDGMLEQYIEDNTFSIFPTMLTTERPDRTAANVMEGRVAILCDGVPFAKLVPVTVYSMIQSPEDFYMRFPYGTLLRYIRLIGILFTVFLPSLYIAMTNFHQEMLPTELLIAIAKAKENVPFPTILEVLLMEISFELIREAGIRIPGIIGNTLGIIGALILGQAAVQANIVSPILIIVVAITGLGNFAIPNFSFALALRLSRFLFIIAGAMLGFYGITIVGMFLGFYLINQKSFGVPFFAPIAPVTRKSNDLIIRYPIWKQEFRADFLNTTGRGRQSGLSRKWMQEKPRYRRDKEGDDDERR